MLITSVCGRCKKEKSITEYTAVDAKKIQEIKLGERKKCKPYNCASCKENAKRQSYQKQKMMRVESNNGSYYGHTVCWLEKPCKKCGEIKPLNKYKSAKDRFDRRSSVCNSCLYSTSCLYSAGVKEYKKLWWQKNGHKRKPEDPEKRKIRVKRYRKNRSKSPEYRINKRMSEMIRKGLRLGKQGKSWRSMVDYSVDELKMHLEKQFTKGMTWEKFLSGEIHIDHVVPKSSFSYTSYDDNDFKACWDLPNLMPLWAKDNIRKSSKKLTLL